MQKRFSIGVDIGGSHISCAAIDMQEEKVLYETFAESKVNNKASADEIIKVWCSALKATLKDLPMGELAGIGFAMPGPFDYEKGIALFERVEKYESLYGTNVAEAIRQALGLPGEVPVRFMNDASSFAVGEAWIGKGAGHKKVLALTLGTGFGSAFVADGIPVVEGESVPQMGCVWHLPYRDGIADDYFSTRWFERSYKELTGIEVSGVYPIAQKAATEAAAASLFKQLGQNLASFLLPWLQKFGAEVVVIGGNVTGSYHLFGKYYEEDLSKTGIVAPIEISELKEYAAIIGSARLMQEDYWDKVKFLLSKM
jgi:glucokinase